MQELLEPLRSEDLKQTFFVFDDQKNTSFECFIIRELDINIGCLFVFISPSYFVHVPRHYKAKLNYE